MDHPTNPHNTHCLNPEIVCAIHDVVIDDVVFEKITKSIAWMDDFVENKMSFPVGEIVLTIFSDKGETNILELGSQYHKLVSEFYSNVCCDGRWQILYESGRIRKKWNREMSRMDYFPDSDDSPFADPRTISLYCTYNPFQRGMYGC